MCAALFIVDLILCGWLVGQGHLPLLLPDAKHRFQPADVRHRFTGLHAPSKPAAVQADAWLEELRHEEKRQRPQEGRN